MDEIVDRARASMWDRPRSWFAPECRTRSPVTRSSSCTPTAPRRRNCWELHDWLLGLGVRQVAMESTGVYWKSVHYLLEDDFTVLLVNAAHVKHVPGRKTDTIDAVWLAQLLAHGPALTELRAA